MFRNYFVTAWRNIWKHKTFSYINLGGLAIGITAVLLIGSYIQSEISYDVFHKNRDDIYRVGFRSFQQGTETGVAPDLTAPFSVDAKKQFPEIKSYCRISENHEAWFLYNGKSIKTAAVTYADSSFFSLFSFPILSGNPATALQNPNSIVLSRALATKIFGNKEAVGERISVDGKTSYMVTGVATDAPANSTVQYEALISMSTTYNDSTWFLDWNGGWQFHHYLQLEPDANAAALENKFKDFMWANYNEKYAGSSRIDALLQPLSKIHLYYSADSENTRTNIFVFGIIALLILVISCINYINLSVAGASSRFKEIGVRKVLGASRKQLVKQFIGETLLVTVFAIGLACVLTTALFPLYQQLSGKLIVIDTAEIIFIALLMLVLLVVISVAAGGYLAFYLSSLNPVSSFKMKMPKAGKQNLGKALIIFQFAITAALISAVLIVQMQLGYIKSKPPGFDKEHMIVLPLTGNAIQDKATLLKKQLASLAGVAEVSAMSEVPYNNITQNGFVPEGSKSYSTFHQLDADEDFLKTMNIHLLAGSYFSISQQTNEDGFIINQALADELGWKDPVNKTITRSGVHRVIGVVQNFHFASMHDKIEPLIITNKPWMNRYGFLAIKYNASNPADLISNMQDLWKQYAAGAPFDYWFLDEAYDNLYKAEDKFRKLFFCFSVLSILLSLAGVFGLVMLKIQQKQKEIGIRKVLGASIADIIRLTARNFLLLIIVASTIAIPVAWFYANVWLQNFAYRISMQWWMFVLPVVAVPIIVFIVISLQTGKAAMANPVKSLRSE